jgi:hypothetical protein
MSASDRDHGLSAVFGPPAVAGPSVANAGDSRGSPPCRMTGFAPQALGLSVIPNKGHFFIATVAEMALRCGLREGHEYTLYAYQCTGPGPGQ